MGFDFGDSNPEQDAPAAGFRIKQLKPASNADAGEQDQENYSQDITSEQSVVNTGSLSAPVKGNGDTAAPEEAPAIIESENDNQQSENDPHNDSEVIPNTPVTSGAEAETAQPDSEAEQEQEHTGSSAQPETVLPAAVPGQTQQDAPGSDEAATVDKMIEEEEKEENSTPETPVKAEKPAGTRPNIPSRLTRPTQVYAVEDETPGPPQKINKNAVFTPATADISKTEAVVTTENSSEVNQAPAADVSAVVDAEVVQPADAKPATTKAATTEVESAVVEPSESVPVAAEPEATTYIAAEPPVYYQSAQQEQETEPTEEESEVYYQEAEVETAANPEPEQPKKSTRGRKSLKSLDAEAGFVNIPDDSTLFKRQYYSIGEVAGMFAVNQSLLRFWENEFDVIQPRKNRKGDRHFRPVDIKNLELIYDLLRRRKLTIEGAKEFLKKNKQARERFEMIQSLQQIKGFLLEIKASL